MSLLSIYVVSARLLQLFSRGLARVISPLGCWHAAVKDSYPRVASPSSFPSSLLKYTPVHPKSSRRAPRELARLQDFDHSNYTPHLCCPHDSLASTLHAVTGTEARFQTRFQRTDSALDPNLAQQSSSKSRL